MMVAIARADMRRRLVDFAVRVANQGLVSKALEKGPDTVLPLDERPLDLFDRKPLKVVLADGGLVIYSIDIDGDDDGGAESVPRSPRRDATFCFGPAFQKRRLEPKKDDDGL